MYKGRGGKWSYEWQEQARPRQPIRAQRVTSQPPASNHGEARDASRPPAANQSTIWCHGSQEPIRSADRSRDVTLLTGEPNWNCCRCFERLTPLCVMGVRLGSPRYHISCDAPRFSREGGPQLVSHDAERRQYLGELRVLSLLFTQSGHIKSNCKLKLLGAVLYFRKNTLREINFFEYNF